MMNSSAVLLIITGISTGAVASNVRISTRHISLGYLSRAPEDFLPPEIRVPQIRFSGGDVATNAAWRLTLADVPDPEPHLMQTLPSGEGWSLLGLLSRSGAIPLRPRRRPRSELLSAASNFWLRSRGCLQDLSTEIVAGDDRDIFDHRFTPDEAHLELPYEVAGIWFGRLTQEVTAKDSDYDNSAT